MTLIPPLSPCVPVYLPASLPVGMPASLATSLPTIPLPFDGSIPPSLLPFLPFSLRPSDPFFPQIPPSDSPFSPSFTPALLPIYHFGILDTNLRISKGQYSAISGSYGLKRYFLRVSDPALPLPNKNSISKILTNYPIS